MARLSFSILAIPLLLAIVSATIEEELDAVTFGYSGPHGPSHWGELNPAFHECSSGKHQSPVNIIRNHTIYEKSLKPLTRNYRSSANATLINMGFTIGVHYEAHIGDLFVDGKNYTFKQMHWHSPSEHLIDGKRFPAELHLVHVAADQSAAVESILYKYGSPDPLLNKENVLNLLMIFQKSESAFTRQISEKLKKWLYQLANMKTKGAQISIGELNTKHMRRKTHKYYRYYGSFTTPPCTETVVWSVLAEVRSISKEQLDALSAPLFSDCKKNSRPCQPLNDRRIEIFSAK